jgi:hypothetical protein
MLILIGQRAFTFRIWTWTQVLICGFSESAEGIWGQAGSSGAGCLWLWQVAWMARVGQRLMREVAGIVLRA